MKKSELRDLISQKFGISKRVAKSVMEFFLEMVLKTLKEKNKVYVAGLGTFKLKKQDRTFVNPKTKEKVIKQGHTRIKFRPSKSVLKKF